MERAGGAAQAEEYQRSSGHSTEPRGKDVKTDPPSDGLFLTVATVGPGRRAAKRFTPRGVEDYKAGSRFRLREVRIETPAALREFLAAQESRRDEFALFGAINAPWRNEGNGWLPWDGEGPDPARERAGWSPRWLFDRPDGMRREGRRIDPAGVASLVDCGSRIVHFDVDDLALPEGMSWGDPARLAAWTWGEICRRLPPFEGVAYAWQASSSAGTPGKADKAKFHLWAMLDQSIDAATRRVLLGVAGADAQIATPNHASYTAAPLFEGAVDPLAKAGRSGFEPGRRDFASWEALARLLPAPEIKQERERTKARQENRGAETDISAFADQQTTDRARRFLEGSCRNLSRITDDRNPAIYRYSKSVAGVVAYGELNPDEARAALADAAQATGLAEWRRPLENGFAEGLLHPWSPDDTPPRPPRQPEQNAPPAPMAYPERGDDNRERGAARHRDEIKAFIHRSVRRSRTRDALAQEFAEIRQAHPMPEADDDGGRRRVKAERRKMQAEARARVYARHGANPALMARLAERTMQTGAQGIGKTQTALGEVLGARGLVVWFLAPTREKAQEAAAEYERLRGEAVQNGEAAPPVGMVWEGRSAKGMCAFPEEAAEASKRGVNVARAMCDGCTLKDVCAYQSNVKTLRELARAPEGLVMFAAHEIGTVNLPARVIPDFVIWDEAPRGQMVADHPVTMPLAELGSDRQPPRPSADPNRLRPSAAREAGDMADALADLLFKARPAEVAVLHALRDHPGRELEFLRSRGWTAEKVREAAAVLRRFEDKSLETAMQAAMAESGFALVDAGRNLVRRRLKQALDNTAEKSARLARMVLEAVSLEMDTPRPGLVAVRLNKEGARVEAWRRTRLTLRERTPMLILDGTGEEAVARAAFGCERLRQVHIPVERNAYVVQVTGKSFANRSLTGEQFGAPFNPDDAERLRRELAEVIGLYPGAWVAGNKSVMAALIPLLHDAVTGHFGALRGLNRAEHCEVGFSLGRELPRPEALENKAAALHATDPEPIKRLNPKDGWPMEVRALRMRDGSVQTVKIAVHPDPRVDAILRQVRDAEVAQNIDRPRPMFNRRLLFILGEVAADVTVDEVVTEMKRRLQVVPARPKTGSKSD